MTSYDTSIADAIKQEIIKSMKTTAKDIHVTVRDNKVLLTGMVNVLYEKLKCQELVGKIEGIKSVENDIAITTDGTVTDKELTDLLNKNLRCSEYADKFIGITGKVNGGSALLVGEVESEKYKKLALLEGSKTFGIKDVVNSIEITGTSEDVNICNKIFERLTESGIDVSDMTYIVSNNEVTLSGYARNEREINKIIDIVEGLETIKHVRNKLKPRPWETDIKD